MSERVRVNFENGVADVRLARADKMNALDQAMFEELVATGKELATRKDLRVVVISGEGRAFCAGLDMGRFQQMAGGGGDEMANEIRLGRRTHGPSNGPQYVAMVWQEVPVPVIAAVHGVAFGGGLQIALGADMRFVTSDAKLSVMEIKWGLVPDMGGIELMRHLARDDVVRELCFTGRVITGAEAHALGLATRVCDDPYAEAMALAVEIAAKSPDGIRAAKRLLGLARHADTATVLQAESDEQIKLLGSPNQVEAVLANLEKRAPRFKDPG